jgi:hypothetical protein
MAVGSICASCGADASDTSPLRIIRVGNASVKLCPGCRSSSGDGYTTDSVGTECSSCGDDSADANVTSTALIPTLGHASTTVNLCRSCREPVEEWQGTITEARDLEALGVTTTLLDKNRADDITKSHGVIAEPMANIGMSPALIAQTLNRRGYALPEQANGWTGSSAAALVQRYRALRSGAVEM